MPVRAFIEEVEVGATMEANGKGLTLAVTTVEPEVEVRVDRQLLAAAVHNLLQNAFEFTRPGGRVSLKTSSIEDRVVIEADGGEIRVRDIPGKGCVFTIELPRLSPAPDKVTPLATA